MKQEYNYNQLSEKDILRFWNNVAIPAQENKCWEWKKSKSHNGYGQFNFSNGIGKKAIAVRATRVSYYLHNKHIDDKLLVCHTCDNPGCVNPNHLFLGTQVENMKDCIEKGRFVITKGQDRSKKLKNEDILKIKELFLSGIKQPDIAKIYNMHQCNISRIVTGKRWSHLNNEFLLTIKN